MDFLKQKAATISYAQFQLALSVVVAWIVALLVRLYLVMQIDFPFNDGGMFYQTIQDILDHGFSFFPYLSYNFSHIPFAYPPLSFYLAAGLHTVFDIEILTILRYYPAIVSSLIIPAAFVFFRQLTLDRKMIVSSLFVLAIVPNTLEWQIMGGGLSRATGMVLSFLSAGVVIYTLQSKHFLLKWILVAAGLIAITTATHLEGFVFLTIACGCWVLLNGVNRSFVLRTVTIYVTALVLLLPWIAQVYIWHGMDPFLSALQSGTSAWGGIRDMLNHIVSLHFVLAGDVGLVNTLVVVGIVYAVRARNYFAPLLLIVVLFGMVRSGLQYAGLPVSLLAGISLAHVWDNLKIDLHAKKTATLFVVCLVIILYMTNQLLVFRDMVQSSSLTYEERTVMDWVRNNTPSESKFLVLSNTPLIYWGHSKGSEWFPVLAQRQSLTTVQGTEWLRGEFLRALQQNTQLNECKADIACYDEVLSTYDLDYNYIYLHPQLLWELSAASYTELLKERLTVDSGFSLEYTSESGSITVWKKG